MSETHSHGGDHAGHSHGVSANADAGKLSVEWLPKGVDVTFKTS